MFPTDMDIQSVQYISRLFSISEICGTQKEIGVLPAHCAPTGSSSLLSRRFPEEEQAIG